MDGEVILPRHGKLETYSIMTRKPPYAVIDAPYVLGQVDTGPASVISVIQARAEDLSVGMAVELVSESLKEDEDGNQLVTYYFRPSAGT